MFGQPSAPAFLPVEPQRCLPPQCSNNWEILAPGNFLPAAKDAGQWIINFRSEVMAELVIFRQSSEIELATAFIECYEVNLS